MEKCPRGTSESVALLRHNVERKQEEDVRSVGKEGGRKEDAHTQRGRDDCTEETGRSRMERKDGEKPMESCAPPESKKDGSGRVQLWNPTTCHVPGGPQALFG
ncbi:hypothetical protein NDU88_004704 [Pleurodeles waltl]|uniref:Uncharacterized protein n=1 Tax=Pleurodeles waltl TaxID=8319 RepID=A0AAV7WV63_PLEWA|nr:hypothetical protein NDU88_004704 [Pleurodeles waltl]